MKKNSSKRSKKALKNNPKSNLLVFKLSTLAVALAVVFYIGTSIFQSIENHDLSVIGNGKPTVVQVHDPN